MELIFFLGIVILGVLLYDTRSRLTSLERQVRGEPGQPLGLPSRLLRGPADPRQPHRQVVPEPVDVVVRPV